MKIALLHYTYAPLVGGVENIMEQHAALFTGRGHEVTVICSEGASEDPAVPVALVPEMQRDHPLVKSAQKELDGGAPGESLAELKNKLATALTPLIQDADIVFLHNVLTMHFHLALTVALWRLIEKFGGVRFIAWTHDIAASNPDYSFPHLGQEPWNLLKKCNPHAEYVAISELRKQQFDKLTDAAPSVCAVVPNGIDPAVYLDLSAPVAKLAREHRILEKEIVLLHPTRILKRKNIELGLRVMAQIKARGKRCCCIVTGPADFHNPDTAKYHASLMRLRFKLGLADDFLFLHEFFAVTNRDLAGLYRVADMLFYPSKQEGFGLPMLEGALHRVPIFCADIEPMKSIAQGNTTFFDLHADPGDLADSIISQVSNSPAIQSRKAMLRDYSWDTLYPLRLGPLLQNKSQR